MSWFARSEVGRRLVRNVSSNYAGFAVRQGVMLFLTPYLVDRLGEGAFGAWVVLQSILGYFQLLELGVIPAVIRQVSQFEARGEKDAVAHTLGAATLMLLAAAVLVLPLAVALSWLGPAAFDLVDVSEETFATATVLVGVGGVLAFFKRLYYATLEGYQRYDLINLCSIASVVLGAVATVVVIETNGGLLGIVLVLLGETALAAMLQLVLLMRVQRLRYHPLRTTKERLKEVSVYSSFACLIDLSLTVSYRIDAVVIAIFLPMNAVTYYHVATRLTALLERLVDPIVSVLFPLASQLDAGKDSTALSRLLIVGTQISALLVTPGVVMALHHGADVIAWWMGEEFDVARSLPVLHVFLGVIAVATIESTASHVLLGTGRVRFDAYVCLGAAVLNLTLSLLLVGRYGLLGVALGTLVPTVIGKLFVSVPYACWVTGTSLLEFLVHTMALPLAVGLLSSGALLLLGLLPWHPVALFVLGGLCCSGLAAVPLVVIARSLRAADSRLQ